MPNRPAHRAATLAAALLGCPALLLAGCSAPVGAPVGALPTVAAAGLPPEARQTLRLIDAGGPFPYAKDGSVFGNVEGILPPHRRGYYHEYTVPTPGERDRGARRIVTGSGGEAYYTDDHYQTFRTVRR
jgi:ribonuclease T1